ncbi:unnamed protein product [Arabidopsis arenosa]|uniref:Uncharacterized protein n=1 Tax=Arabidopsis arenosa TaxID=38785 RepID=A0A8S2AQI2_ARAAE|nr:unnamed protein product [Arabidopsis arenosa]
MSMDLDKAIQKMSIADADDKPLILSNQPQKLQDKRKQKEGLVKELDSVISNPSGASFMADARKGLEKSSGCEASSSGSGFKTYKMKKPNLSWLRKAKPGKEPPLKTKVMDLLGEEIEMINGFNAS